MFVSSDSAVRSCVSCWHSNEAGHHTIEWCDPHEQIFNGQTVFTSLKHLSAVTHKFRDTNRIIRIRLSLRRFVFWQRQRYALYRG